MTTNTIQQTLPHLPNLSFDFGLQLDESQFPQQNTSKVEEIGAVHGPGEAILEIERQALFLLLYYTRA